MNGSKVDLLKAFEQLHSDVLSVIGESRLDSSAKQRLCSIADDIVGLMAECQSKPRVDRDVFARAYLLFRSVLDMF